MSEQQHTTENAERLTLAKVEAQLAVIPGIQGDDLPTVVVRRTIARVLHEAGMLADVREWTPEDGDTRCQRCGRAYQPWFTDNPLWNEVMGGSAYGGDPGGCLCSTCFADVAERLFPGLVWRFIPEWSGRAAPMDWPTADAPFTGGDRG